MADRHSPRISSAAPIENHELDRRSIDTGSDVDSLEILDIEEARRVKAKVDEDLEAYPDGVKQSENGIWREESARERGRGLVGVLTRMSTKSSWKDPGPPPDGGTKAWMQGVYSTSYFIIHDDSWLENVFSNSRLFLRLG